MGGVRGLILSDVSVRKRMFMDALHTLRLNKLFSRPLMVRVGYGVVGQGRFYKRGVPLLSEVPRQRDWERGSIKGEEVRAAWVSVVWSSATLPKASLMTP